jgi:hypothetical protein
MRVEIMIAENKVAPWDTSVTRALFTLASGLLKISVHTLTATVTFSEEEKARIKSLKLQRKLIMETEQISTDEYRSHNRKAFKDEHIVNDFVEGPVALHFYTETQARNGMIDLEDALKKLKGHLAIADAPKTKTFEI